MCDRIRARATRLIQTGHDSYIWDTPNSYGTWLIHVGHESFICDMTHSHVTWLIHMGHDSCICNTTHSYVTLIHIRRDSWHRWRLGKTEALQLPRNCAARVCIWCAMTHAYVSWLKYMWHDSCIWLIHTCDMTHASSNPHGIARWKCASGVPWLMHMCRDSITCDTTRAYVTFIRATWLMHMWHSYVWHDSSASSNSRGNSSHHNL